MARRQTSDYKAAELAGRRAEFLTKWLYHLAGYSCVATRQKTPFGELDLIMRRREKILALEVKYRHHPGNADGGAPTARQLKRIRAAILWKSAQHPVFSGKSILVRLMQWLGWLGLRQKNSIFKAITSPLSGRKR